MKTLILIFLIIFSASLFAQTDSLAIKIDADTVIITNYGVNENCCAMFDFQIVKENDSVLVITEIDTGQVCRCGNCNFDLEIKITDLPLGDYLVKIYRDWETFDRPVMFVGDIRFSFYPMHLPLTTFKYEGEQGPCYHEVVGLDDESFPDQIKLFNAYPNPFNPITNIEYYVKTHLNASPHINLSIYNLLGQKVATLVNKKQLAGTYKTKWDARDFPSGIYLYKIETANGIRETKKVILLK